MRKFYLLLFSVFLCAQLFAQTRTIKGQVLDDKGYPLVNATIAVKGAAAATSTDENGGFTISVPANAKAIIVSHIGTAEKTVTLTRETNYSIVLSSATQSLQEVVIVGYGSQRRIEQTGSVATLGGKELENRPLSSFDKMLQGEIPGVQSLAGSGQPGATQNVRVRGIGSISAGSAPLYVVDGIPVAPGDISRLTTTSNTFGGINPNDIESISVLKDAASTSIYGSQAANGVILITTKKGRAGKARFRFDTEVGQNDFAYYNDDYLPLNATEWATITREGLINLGNRPGQADTAVNISSTYGAYSRGYNTDWLSLLTRKGTQKQYNISASGGTDKGTYYVSGGYYDEQGTAIQSRFKRYTAAVRGRNNLSNRFTVTTDVSIGATDQVTPPDGTGFANPIYDAIVLQPTKPAYNADGTLNISDFDFPSGSPFNPLYLAKYDIRKLNGIKGIGSMTGEFKITNDIKFTTRFGVDYNNLEETQFQNPNHGDGRNDGGRGYSYYTRQFSRVWTNFGDYSHLFLNDRLKTDVKVGYEYYRLNILNNSLRADGFPPALDLTLAANAATPKTASATINEKVRVSGFSSLNLLLDNKYVLSGSFRRDGSSVFGANKQYGNFWSVGASWNIDQEKWFAHVPVISQLKLRSSYGINGNESGFGYYQSLQTYGYGFNYNQQPGSAPNNVGDPNLSWELNKPFNAGLDLGVLKNKIVFTADYYDRKTTNLLLDANTSRTTGFSSYLTNIGAMQNKGIELGIKATPLKSADFGWDINFNFTHNKNKITALYQNNDITSGSFVRSVGYDYQTFYTRLWAGVDPANGDPLWYKDATKKETTNNVNLAALVKYGSGTPTYFGGLGNTFTYKGFILDIQLNYSGGNYVRDALGSLYFGDGTSATRNKVKKQLERWQKPGDITNVPKYIVNGNKNSSSFSTRYLYEGDYVRLRNLQLGYSLPATILSKVHATGLTFYVRGTNLLTWVKDKDLPWDPEQGISSETNGEVFIPKTISAGLNLSF